MMSRAALLRRARAVAPSLLAASLLAGGGAAAEPGVAPWTVGDEAELRLVSSVSAVGPGAAEVPLGLHLRLAAGWRIYWRTPGGGGLPPHLDWSGSQNLAAAEMRWPAPTRFETYGQQSYGYAGEVLFPITARLAAPGAPAGFRLALRYLACREVCIPGETTLSLDLPAGAAAATSAAAEIERQARRVPVPASASGVTIRAVPGVEGLTVIARGREVFEAPDLFIEWPPIGSSPARGRRPPALPRPRLTLGDGGREAVFLTPVQPSLLRPGTPLTLTVTDGALAVEAAVLIEPPP